MAISCTTICWPAARWTTPATATPAYDAIKIYRNYDGNRSALGDTTVAAAMLARANAPGDPGVRRFEWRAITDLAASRG